MRPSSQDHASAASDEEDDYMNMAFEDAAPQPETSLQRIQRLKKESQQRGLVKSKAVLAQEAEAAREKALSTSLMDNPNAKMNKGFAMMSKMGFSGGGLGKKDEDGKTPGRSEPIKVNVRDSRSGIGMENERKRQLEEAAQEMGVPAKALKTDPDEFRGRLGKEREDARRETQLLAAQRMAERLDGGGWTESPPETQDKDRLDREKATRPSVISRPLKSVPVEYRGMVLELKNKERDGRMRRQAQPLSTRLPTYEEDEYDNEDRIALNEDDTTYVDAEEMDDEDEELDRFNDLEVEERLGRLLTYLRSKHRYCFWCKLAYPDDELEGCPGITEEEHD